MDSAFEQSSGVRVGIVGVGNCASSLIQGLSYYRDARDNVPIPGLMHSDVGGYRVSDVTITAAFDVNRTKVCLLYTSPSPRDGLLSRMPSSA